MQNVREQRGKAIAELEGTIRRIDDHEYFVQSQSDKAKEYRVFSTESGWNCECPDFTFRGVKCKHVFAVEISLALRTEIKQETKKIDLIVNPSECQYCKSPEIVRAGVRHNKYGDLQIYFCKSCEHYFTLNLGFEKMRASPQAITGAMQLYFSGESLRNVQKFLLLQGVKVSHVAVSKWITKYISLMEKYLDKISPQVSSTWRTDELHLKISGKKNWLFALMDDESRFWIAQQVAEHKGVSDIRQMFQDAKTLTKVKPKKIISDGAPNFERAIRDEFALQNPRPLHVSEIRMDGKVHNNKMERFNGEQRDREKVMRSLKKQDSPILKGMQIYHNYIRPHMALDGKTPSEKAGIKVEGQNKWFTIIQNASLNAKPKRDPLKEYFKGI